MASHAEVWIIATDKTSSGDAIGGRSDTDVANAFPGVAGRAGILGDDGTCFVGTWDCRFARGRDEVIGDIDGINHRNWRDGLDSRRCIGSGAGRAAADHDAQACRRVCVIFQVGCSAEISFLGGALVDQTGDNGVDLRDIAVERVYVRAIALVDQCAFLVGSREGAADGWRCG